jgi:peroxiredoxin Q/BCP
VKSEALIVGGPAPVIELPTATGAFERLTDHLGANVVLIFYRGHWCPVCRRQLGQLRDAYSSIRGMNAEILAVSTQSTAEIAVSLHAATLPFPLLSDDEAKVIEPLGLAVHDDDRDRWLARPTTVLINRQGTIRFAHVGEHPRDRPALGAILLALEWMNRPAMADQVS